MTGRLTPAYVAAASLLAALAVPGCATPMEGLRGDRGLTSWISAPASRPEAVRVPAVFTLRNPTLGSVRIESVRVPIGTEVTTEPPLPARVAPGGTLLVTVVATFRPEEGDRVRRVQLQCAGQPDLVLTVDGRFQPAPPVDSSAPQPVSPAAGR